MDGVDVHGVGYPEGMIQSDFADTPELEDEKWGEGVFWVGEGKGEREKGLEGGVAEGVLEETRGWQDLDTVG